MSLCVIEKEDIIKEELTTYFRSVILFGRARILETDEEILHAARVFSLRYNADRDFVEKEIQNEWSNLCCVEISIEHMTGKEANRADPCPAAIKFKPEVVYVYSSSL